MNLWRLLLSWWKVRVLALAPVLFGRSQCPVLTRMFCNVNVVTVDRGWLAFSVFTLICNEFNTDLGKAGVQPLPERDCLCLKLSFELRTPSNLLLQKQLFCYSA